MKALFAAPADAWGGLFYRFQQAFPQFSWHATGTYHIDSLAGYDLLIPTMSSVDQSLLATADRLKLIQQMGSGLEGVDLDAAKACGIAVANVPTGISGNADSVAELGIYLMLGLARRANEIAVHFAAGQLGEPMGTTLKGKTVAIIGLGGVGSALARRLRAFEVRLLGIRRHPDVQQNEALGLHWTGTPAQLDTVLGECDYLVLTLPDNGQTHHLLDVRRLMLLKSGAFIVNLGRGGLIDPDALQAALHSGRIAGAGLDVFWQEPPDLNHPLFKENVIVTPHIGGITDLSLNGIFDGVCANVRRLITQQPLLHRAV